MWSKPIIPQIRGKRQLLPQTGQMPTVWAPYPQCGAMCQALWRRIGNYKCPSVAMTVNDLGTNLWTNRQERAMQQQEQKPKFGVFSPLLFVQFSSSLFQTALNVLDKTNKNMAKIFGSSGMDRNWDFWGIETTFQHLHNWKQKDTIICGCGEFSLQNKYPPLRCLCSVNITPPFSRAYLF